MTIKICHLIDDAGFGGINRGLEHIKADPDLSAISSHDIVRIKRGKLTPPVIQADVIVSHLSVCWANMPLLTALRAFYPRTPIIHVEHSYSERYVAAYVSNHNRFDTLMRAAFSLFDQIVAVSADQAAWLLRRRFVSKDRLRTIESCASLKEFVAVEERIVGEKLIIGAIGRFHVQKGFDILVEAVRKAARADLELHLYGDGPQRGELEALAEGCPSIVFKGYVRDTSAAMAACDVVAMPSRWEPYGLVAVEAMAARRAVVCSNADGLAGHIRTGAIEVSDNTVRGWTDWLANVRPEDINRNIDRCWSYGRSAETRFSTSWINLYREMTGVEDADRQLMAA